MKGLPPTQNCDRDVPPAIWNTYLRKYNDTYRVKRHGDSTSRILCREGDIDLFSLTERSEVWLGYFYAPKSTKSQSKTYLLKRLKKADCPFEIVQEGSSEIYLAFPERELAKFEDALRIRKKWRLPSKARQKATLRLEAYRFKKQTQENSTPGSQNERTEADVC